MRPVSPVLLTSITDRLGEYKNVPRIDDNTRDELEPMYYIRFEGARMGR